MKYYQQTLTEATKLNASGTVHVDARALTGSGTLGWYSKNGSTYTLLQSYGAVPNTTNAMMTLTTQAPVAAAAGIYVFACINGANFAELSQFDNLVLEQVVDEAGGVKFAKTFDITADTTNPYKFLFTETDKNGTTNLISEFEVPQSGAVTISDVDDHLAMVPAALSWVKFQSQYLLLHPLEIPADLEITTFGYIYFDTANINQANGIHLDARITNADGITTIIDNIPITHDWTQGYIAIDGDFVFNAPELSEVTLILNYSTTGANGGITSIQLTTTSSPPFSEGLAYVGASYIKEGTVGDSAEYTFYDINKNGDQKEWGKITIPNHPEPLIAVNDENLVFTTSEFISTTLSGGYITFQPSNVDREVFISGELVVETKDGDPWDNTYDKMIVAISSDHAYWALMNNYNYSYTSPTVTISFFENIPLTIPANHNQIAYMNAAGGNVDILPNIISSNITIASATPGDLGLKFVETLGIEQNASSSAQYDFTKTDKNNTKTTWGSLTIPEQQPPLIADSDEYLSNYNVHRTLPVQLNADGTIGPFYGSDVQGIFSVSGTVGAGTATVASTYAFAVFEYTNDVSPQTTDQVLTILDFNDFEVGDDIVFNLSTTRTPFYKNNGKKKIYLAVAYMATINDRAFAPIVDQSLTIKNDNEGIAFDGKLELKSNTDKTEWTFISNKKPGQGTEVWGTLTIPEIPPEIAQSELSLEYRNQNNSITPTINSITKVIAIPAIGSTSLYYEGSVDYGTISVSGNSTFAFYKGDPDNPDLANDEFIRGQVNSISAGPLVINLVRDSFITELGARYYIAMTINGNLYPPIDISNLKLETIDKGLKINEKVQIVDTVLPDGSTKYDFQKINKNSVTSTWGTIEVPGSISSQISAADTHLEVVQTIPGSANINSSGAIEIVNPQDGSEVFLSGYINFGIAPTGGTYSCRVKLGDPNNPQDSDTEIVQIPTSTYTTGEAISISLAPPISFTTNPGETYYIVCFFSAFVIQSATSIDNLTVTSGNPVNDGLRFAGGYEIISPPSGGVNYIFQETKKDGTTTQEIIRTGGVVVDMTDVALVNNIYIDTTINFTQVNDKIIAISCVDPSARNLEFAFSGAIPITKGGSYAVDLLLMEGDPYNPESTDQQIAVLGDASATSGIDTSITITNTNTFGPLNSYYLLLDDSGAGKFNSVGTLAATTTDGTGGLKFVQALGVEQNPQYPRQFIFTKTDKNNIKTNWGMLEIPAQTMPLISSTDENLEIVDEDLAIPATLTQSGSNEIKIDGIAGAILEMSGYVEVTILQTTTTYSYYRIYDSLGNELPRFDQPNQPLFYLSSNTPGTYTVNVEGSIAKYLPNPGETYFIRADNSTYNDRWQFSSITGLSGDYYDSVEALKFTETLSASVDATNPRKFEFKKTNKNNITTTWGTIEVPAQADTVIAPTDTALKYVDETAVIIHNCDIAATMDCFEIDVSALPGVTRLTLNGAFEFGTWPSGTPTGLIGLVEDRTTIVSPIGGTCDYTIMSMMPEILDFNDYVFDADPTKTYQICCLWTAPTMQDNDACTWEETLPLTHGLKFVQETQLLEGSNTGDIVLRTTDKNGNITNQTINTGIANKQDKPATATEDNLATFNSTKSTVDSGLSVLKQAAATTTLIDPTSTDTNLPTSKAVYVYGQAIKNEAASASYQGRFLYLGTKAMINSLPAGEITGLMNNFGVAIGDTSCRAVGYTGSPNAFTSLEIGTWDGTSWTWTAASPIVNGMWFYVYFTLTPVAPLGTIPLTISGDEEVTIGAIPLDATIDFSGTVSLEVTNTPDGYSSYLEVWDSQGNRINQNDGNTEIAIINDSSSGYNIGDTITINIASHYDLYATEQYYIKAVFPYTPWWKFTSVSNARATYSGAGSGKEARGTIKDDGVNPRSIDVYLLTHPGNPDDVSIELDINQQLTVKDWGITANKIADGAVTNTKIGNRQLSDDAGSGTLVDATTGHSYTSFLQLIRNNLKWLINNFNAGGQANSASIADRLTNTRQISINSTLTTAGSFNGTADIEIGIPTSFSDDAASTTLPTTATQPLTTKLNQIRANLKALLNNFNGSAAKSADKLTTARTLSINSTLATQSASFDGTANVELGVSVTVPDGTATNTMPAVTATNLSGWLAAIRNVVKWLVARFDASGNANTAVKLTTARTITIDQTSTGNASFDGSANVTVGMSIALQDAAASTTLPTTTAGTLESKLNATRANLKQLFTYFNSGNANKADQLTNARTITVDPTVTTAASFNGTANVSAGVSVSIADGTAANTLPTTSASALSSWLATARNALKWLVARFDSSGNANSALQLTNARTIQTNLASTSTASFNGTANVTPGVTGTLPIGNGGTGATTAFGARKNLSLNLSTGGNGWAVLLENFKVSGSNVSYAELVIASNASSTPIAIIYAQNSGSGGATLVRGISNNLSATWDYDGNTLRIGGSTNGPISCSPVVLSANITNISMAYGGGYANTVAMTSLTNPGSGVFLPLSGGTMTGNITMGGNIVANGANRFIDGFGQVQSTYSLADQFMNSGGDVAWADTANWDSDGVNLHSIADPTQETDGVNKRYVDNHTLPPTISGVAQNIHRTYSGIQVKEVFYQTSWNEATIIQGNNDFDLATLSTSAVFLSMSGYVSLFNSRNKYFVGHKIENPYAVPVSTNVFYDASDGKLKLRLTIEGNISNDLRDYLAKPEVIVIVTYAV